MSIKKNNFSETHRGISTTLKRKFEKKPKTVKNRFGQLTLSLPRIDNNKRWAGFAGLSGTANEIASLIPRSKIYCEPFAGKSCVFQELKNKQYRTAILNDTSPFIRKWLHENFSARITAYDFKECMQRFDSKETFFLIDPPWYKSYYDQSFSSFNRKSVNEYQDKILELCHQIKGKFIITTRKESIRMLRSGFNHKTITSTYVLSGHYPKVLLTSNLRLK